MSKEKVQTQPQVLNVTKVTLGSGKVVFLRELKIRHTKLAAQAAGKKAGENKALLAMEMQEELLRQLVVEVDGARVHQSQLISLDDLFSVAEYSQLLKVISTMSGDDLGEPQISMSNTGEQSPT